MEEQGSLPNCSERDFNDLRKRNGGQVLNYAGCYTNEIDDLKRLERFVLFGSEFGYLAPEVELTRERVQFLDRLINEGRGVEAVQMLTKLSGGKRNLRQKPLLYAFALCARCDHRPTKKEAYRSFQTVCRTSTHLFLFVKFCENLSAPGSGWGRAHKTAIQRWYLKFEDKPDELLRLVTKYKRREGWTHKDVLRLAHPKPPNPALLYIFGYITDSEQYRSIPEVPDDNHSLKQLMEKTQALTDAVRCTNEDEMRHLIQEFGLTWEQIPTEMLNKATVWQELLKHIPNEALLKNLVRMTILGVFQENSLEEELAVAKIGSMNVPTTGETAEDEDDDDNDNYVTRKQNIIHPFRIFCALQVYKTGGRIGRRQLHCNPNPSIIRALENAFHMAFQQLEPINKKCMIAFEVSALMQEPIQGMREVNCLMAAAAVAMCLARVAQSTIIGGFNTTFTVKDINELNTFETILQKMTDIPLAEEQHSDCSAPIKWAMEQQSRDIDAFIIFTSNNNSGRYVHPAEAVRQYRKYAQNNRVKLISCGMCNNDFSIADQLDWRMIDVVGFDQALPHLIAEFIREDD